MASTSAGVEAEVRAAGAAFANEALSRLAEVAEG